MAVRPDARGEKTGQRRVDFREHRDDANEREGEVEEDQDYVVLVRLHNLRKTIRACQT